MESERERAIVFLFSPSFSATRKIWGNAKGGRTERARKIFPARMPAFPAKKAKGTGTDFLTRGRWGGGGGKGRLRMRPVSLAKTRSKDKEREKEFFSRVHP